MRYLGVELHSDEEVKSVVRRFAMLSLFLPFLISAILVIGAFYLFVPLWNLHLWSWDISVAGRAVFFAALAFGVLHALRAYVTWRGTLLVLTNQRIVDVDRRGFFDRTVSEVPFQSLSDVSYRSKGLVEMLSNIGTITFQLYSGNENVSFRHLMNPAALHKKILELRVAYLSGEPAVEDPVEGIMGRVGKLSPTEQRALLAGLKKNVPGRPEKKPPRKPELP